jgi:hypothetical protein
MSRTWSELEREIRDLTRALRTAQEAAHIAERRAAAAEDASRRAWYVASGGRGRPADPRGASS